MQGFSLLISDLQLIIIRDFWTETIMTVCRVSSTMQIILILDKFISYILAVRFFHFLLDTIRSRYLNPPTAKSCHDHNESLFSQSQLAVGLFL